MPKDCRFPTETSPRRSPDGEARVGSKQVDARLRVLKNCARAADLELHEALPPVVDETRRLREHAVRDLRAGSSGGLQDLVYGDSVRAITQVTIALKHRLNAQQPYAQNPVDM